VTEPGDAPGAELARRTEPEPMPDEHERIGRAEAMRLLGVSTTQLAARVSSGDLRSWRVGRDVIYERAEVEALAGRAPGGETVLREAVKLLKQSHDHNEAALKLLLEGARGFGEMTRGVIEKVLERNRKLEDEMAAGRDALQKAGADESAQAIAMMKAEAELERDRAVVRAAERLVPVAMARLQQGSPAEDAALAAAARGLAADDELVARMRSGLTADQRLAFDSLVQTLRGAKRAPVDGTKLVDAKADGAPPAGQNGGTT
jgi:hypothetical protein